MPNNQFSYANYQKFHFKQRTCSCIPVRAPQSPTYQGSDMDDFFYLSYVGARENPNINKIRGWKIHISVDDSEPNKNNLVHGWDIVKDILIRHDIQECKVVIPDVPQGGLALNLEEKQYGKQITLYCSMDPRADQQDFWKNRLQEIETAFVTHRIRRDPTATHYGEPNIQGSHYFTYRNDAQVATKYINHAYLLVYLKQIPAEERQAYPIFNQLPNIDLLSSYELPAHRGMSVEILSGNLGLEIAKNSHEIARALSKLANQSEIITTLRYIVDNPGGCHGRRGYEDNTHLFPNPFADIIVVHPAPPPPTLYETIFGGHYAKNSEVVVPNVLHNNDRTP